MKKIKNIEKFSDRDWEVMASILSGERVKNPDDEELSMANDNFKTGKYWNELNNMSKNNLNEINVDKAWSNLHSRIVEETEGIERIVSEKRFSINVILKIASIIFAIIGLSLTALYLNNSISLTKAMIVRTEPDQKNVEVFLPDGSKVILNRGTNLSYPKKFGQGTRLVKLNGEALFDITPDPSKPFIIDAGKAKVTVVGTTFNVITNNNVNAVEVFVKSGKVLLSDSTGNNNITLEPGYMGILNSKIVSKKINTDQNYLAWNTGVLVYTGQKLDIVFNDLKRVYNMDVVADNPEILEHLWTSPIDNQSQETIIRFICLSFNLDYKKEGNIYHLSEK